MKHTNFSTKFGEIRSQLLSELKTALKAHGGKIVFKEVTPILRSSDYCTELEILVLALRESGEVVIEKAAQDVDGITCWVEDNVPINDKIAIEDIDGIFELIPETEEVKNVSEEEYFPVLLFSKDDLKQKRFITDGLTSGKLADIAAEIGEKYCNSMNYWDDMIGVAESHNIPRKTILEASDEWWNDLLNHEKQDLFIKHVPEHPDICLNMCQAWWESLVDENKESLYNEYNY